MKLIAREPIKYGKEGETAQPGETFDCPEASVQQLLELGAAEKPTGKSDDKGKDK